MKATETPPFLTNKPSVGSAMEAAYWYNAADAAAKKDAEVNVRSAFESVEDQLGCRFGPLAWEDVDPLSPRVPDPPPWMQGQVRALIGMGVIFTYPNARIESKFIADLEEEDLRKLRAATRKMFAKSGGIALTDEECDEIINEYGPDAALDDLRRN